MNLRRVVPVPVRRFGRALQSHLIYARVGIRALRRRPRLRRALRELRERGAASPSSELLARLMYAWGNEKYAASPAFLAATVEATRLVDGAILECGSGLSTLVLGIEAEKRGLHVYSLEQNKRWVRRVRRALDHHDVRAVEIAHAPVRRFEGYVWYGISPAALPPSFGLVVCDGPAQFEGGRYGLLPALRDRFGPNTVILLDDAVRERGVLVRWADEFGAAWRLEGTEKPFASVRLA